MALVVWAIRGHQCVDSTPELAHRIGSRTHEQSFKTSIMIIVYLRLKSAFFRVQGPCSPTMLSCRNGGSESVPPNPCDPVCAAH